ncbi:TIR domain-containing protein [Patescibacteria group bacterium]
MESKRKVFISYHHKDEYYKKEFEKLCGDFIINKSVQNGDIGTDLSTEYIKRLIQSPDYLRDASICVVLIGSETWGRKHIDWEISGALDKKLSGYSGLVGILLPDHPDYCNSGFQPENIPIRLLDNQKTGYAEIYNWTEYQFGLKNILEEAFNKRIEKSYLIDNSRVQFSYNKN